MSKQSGSNFEDTWKVVSGGHSWKDTPFFIQDVYTQQGNVCAAYLLELYQSREIKEPTAININAFVDLFSEKSNKDNVKTVTKAIKDSKFSMDTSDFKIDIRAMKWADSIVPTFSTELSPDDMIERLQRGPFIAVVQAGPKFCVYKSWFGLESKLSYYSPGRTDQESEGRHALFVIGYRKCRPFLSDQMHFLVKNSWIHMSGSNIKEFINLNGIKRC